MLWIIEIWLMPAWQAEINELRSIRFDSPSVNLCICPSVCVSICPTFTLWLLLWACAIGAPMIFLPFGMSDADASPRNLTRLKKIGNFLVFKIVWKMFFLKYCYIFGIKITINSSIFREITCFFDIIDSISIMIGYVQPCLHFSVMRDKCWQISKKSGKQFHKYTKGYSIWNPQGPCCTNQLRVYYIVCLDPIL